MFITPVFFQGLRLKGFVLALAAVQLIFSTTAICSVFYVDPQNGSPDNNGSRDHPWKTLQQVLEDNLVQARQCETLPYSPDCTMVLKNPDAPIKAGDTIRLLSGYHGEITIQDAYLNEAITIEPEPGNTPKIKSLRCLGASKWIIRELSISPSNSEPYDTIRDLVMLENHDFHGPCKEVTVEDCHVFSVQDSSSWTKDDWNDKSCSGIAVQGPDCIIRNNHLKNVNFGISVSGPNGVIQDNTIENFAGDGLRGLGDNGLFERNLVMNCYDVNENHDDGFQSWSTGADGVGTGEVKGVVLRANSIINYTDPNQPYRGTLQGIGCFDGFYTDWIVENNVIITDHWHGITFLGASNVRIVNNTVLDINQEEPGPVWVKIGPHKDGTASSGWVVRNNIVMSLQVDDTGTADHNLVVDFDWVDKYLMDYAGKDVHLRADSPAIDSGSPDLAPLADHDGVLRPQGSGIDIGAYEWTDQVQPDAGSDANDGDGGQAQDASPADQGVDSGVAQDQNPGQDSGDESKGTNGSDASSGKITAGGCSCGSVSGPGAFLIFLSALGLAIVRRKNRNHG